MEFFGLTPEDYAAEHTAEVWPCNVPAVNLFVSLGTQWRVSFGGAYGLDYGVLPQVLRMSGVPRKEWPDLFESLRILEDAALEEMRKQ